jgi:hypothetical protein
MVIFDLNNDKPKNTKSPFYGNVELNNTFNLFTIVEKRN